MKVLVVGSGGREHALCWQIRERCPDIDLYCAPGNPGIEQVASLVPLAGDEVHSLADFAADLDVDLTIVGPELPLALGIAREFRSRGLLLFGPEPDAARLESSKVFAKEFMKRHGIPTAPFMVVHDEAEARQAVESLGIPCVFKADGLAAGKGVLLVRSEEDLSEALEVFFGHRRFGSAGDRVIVEDLLRGEEVSFIGVSDGSKFLPFATSKDYKRLEEGDEGPNTGGMGAHSPSGVVDAHDARDILQNVMQKTVSAMAEEDTPFRGFLYAGLMLTAEGPYVLEYNVRLGDPEAQALLPRIETDLVRLLEAGARGQFGNERLRFKREAAACIVLASDGYPGSYKKGAPIHGLDDAAALDRVQIFHAGTKRDDDSVLVSGGRVLGVCALGEDLRAALRTAYSASARIRYDGKILRSDIGKAVLEAKEVMKSGIFKLSDLKD